MILPSHGIGWFDGKKPKLAFMDLETYSPIPIGYGSHRYAEAAEVLIWTCALGDSQVYIWDLTLGNPMPVYLKRILEDPDILLVWHNGFNFDSVVLEHALDIRIPPERMWDTMLQALAHSLPGSLDKLCEILGLPQDQRKLKNGKALIHLFCVPRKQGRATRLTHPKEWVEFCEYAMMDIVAMREVFRRMPRWNLRGGELRTLYLDYEINRRGVCVDTELCEAAIRLTNAEKGRLADRARELTNQRVASTTQRDALLQFILSEYDLAISDLTKATVSRLLEQPDLPPVLLELLNNRQSATKTSTAKYAKFLEWVSADGRLRGSLQFCGASRTGRWAGKGLQPHNLPKPMWKGRPMDEKAIDAGLCEDLAEFIKLDSLDLLTDDIMEACAAAIRGAFTARSGTKLVVADLSAIEARVLAWLAGEEWVLEAFRKYDAGTGEDQYKLTYSNMFKVPISAISKSQRQVGKVASLLLQYLGGVGAIVKGATGFNIDIENQIGAVVYPTLSQDIIYKGEEMWDRAMTKEDKREKKREKLRLKIEEETFASEKKKLNSRLEKITSAVFGLDKQTYIACDGLKQLYRQANPNIVRFAYDLENAIRSALQYPGTMYEVGYIQVELKGVWLRVILPSSRCLTYPYMKVKGMDEIKEEDAIDDDVDETNNLMYLGVRPISKKWGWIKTYSGKLVENCFAYDTKVLTKAGIKTIVDITSKDLVWDGYEWVNTEGPIYQGEQEVGEWLGLRLTPDQMIFDGKIWRPVIHMDEITTLEALSWGEKSIQALSGHSYEIRKASTVWKAIPIAEPVYDLLNCGPRHSFTIITAAGPVIVHNCVQAVSRDILVCGMKKAEEAGYKLVLSVHDELITEVPDSPEYTVAELAQCMSAPIPWASGLPLAAVGFEAKRYRK